MAFAHRLAKGGIGCTSRQHRELPDFRYRAGLTPDLEVAFGQLRKRLWRQGEPLEGGVGAYPYRLPDGTSNDRS